MCLFSNNSEEIKMACQKYLSDVPVIFIGSGFSVPYGLPTMENLGNEIKEKIDFKYKELPEWKNFCVNLETTRSLERALSIGRFGEDLTKDIIKTTWNFISEKDRQVYERLFNNSEDLAFSLKEVLLNLLEVHPRVVNIITTNYDKVIEYNVDLVNAILNNGFKGQYKKFFSSFYTNKPTTKKVPVNLCDDKVVNLFKVHGSLDWFKERNSNQIFEFVNTKELLDNYEPLIVTPGIEKYKETYDEPYRSVIVQADDIMRKAKCFLCIGYGFNDSHIQPKLVDRINRNDVPIVIITKNLTTEARNILKNVNNYLVFEESTLNPEETLVSFNGSTVIEQGKIWKLENFIKYWFLE